jgi:pseudaminic acid synthase
VSRALYIDGRPIGTGHPTYVIAEISANHGHSYDRCAELVRLAHRAGADAVKLQTYTADTLTIDCDRPEFLLGEDSTWAGRTLYDLYQEAYTPWEWQPRLKALADELGIALFSTPFDETAVDFLEEMDVPAYKIASFENIDTALLRKVASTGKPVIMSTGLASRAEIESSVQTLREGGCEQLALLKCTSAYPAAPESMNLATLSDLASLGVVVGLSDHTLSNDVSVAAVALGAAVLEKHFIRSRSDGGPDSSFSIEPAELEALVSSVRTVAAALGKLHYGGSEAEASNYVFRRSLFVVQDMKAGEIFTAQNLRSIRPGNGLAPMYLDEVLGQPASRAIERGTPLAWDLIVSGS